MESTNTPSEKPSAQQIESDIPSEVALRCVKALEEKGVSGEVIGRLQTALASTRAPTRQSLTEALFGIEDPDL